MQLKTEIWILSRCRIHSYNHYRVNLFRTYLVKFTLFSFWDRGKQQVKEGNRDWFVLQTKGIFCLKNQGMRLTSPHFIISLEQRGIFLFNFSSLTLKAILSFLDFKSFFLFCCITGYIYTELCPQHVLQVQIIKSLLRYAFIFNWNYCQGKYPSHYGT